MGINRDAQILIIENNPHDWRMIESALLNLGYKNIVRFWNTVEALNNIELLPPLLIIADISDEDQKLCIDFLERVYDKTPVIVVTDSGEETFYQSINDKKNIAYPVKPIHKLTLGATIKILTNEAVIDKSIYLTGSHNIRTKLYLNDIYFFAVEGNYSFAYTRTAKFVAKYSLNKLIERLDDRFIRTHHSFLVNLQHVQSFSSGKVYVEKHTLPLSRTYKQAFVNQLNLLKKP